MGIKFKFKQTKSGLELVKGGMRVFPFGDILVLEIDGVIVFRTKSMQTMAEVINKEVRCELV